MLIDNQEVMRISTLFFNLLMNFSGKANDN